MKHFTEEDLIAYSLHESSDAEPIRQHLEACSACATLAASIAETLRVFSADPVPQPDLDHNWQRLRGNLGVLATDSPGWATGNPAWATGKSGWFRRTRRFLIPAGSLLAAMATLLVVFLTHGGIRLHRTAQVHRNYAINGHGPLTTQPVDPAVANHLDTAERLLTEVNHTTGPLDDLSRAQAHQLLLKNAVYVKQARDRGDLGEASVLDNLGRVLTTLDHEPSTPSTGLHLRLDMNTDGLLLDIRILRQNDARQ